MNKLDLQYQDLLRDILGNGIEKSDRTGTGTLSVFGRQIRHDMKSGFPALTTKKLYFKKVVTELLWFLRGSTNIKFLVDNNCHIWDGDAYANYYKIAGSIEEPNYDIHVDDPNWNRTRLMTEAEFIDRIKADDEFAKKWGELGPIYGKQWRSWGSKRVSKRFYDKQIPYSKFVQEGGIDQIANIINNLKIKPDDRGLIVSAWDVSDLEDMVLRPCHNFFQVWTRELSLEERIRIYALKEGQTYEEFVMNWDTDKEWLEDLSGTNVPTRAISLMFNMRSCDVPLGLPFNIASYGLLLEIIAKEVNMVPDELIGNLGDAHIYKNQIEGISEQLQREPYPLPKLIINDEFWNLDADLISNIPHIEIDDFYLKDYKFHPAIKLPLSN